MRKPYYTKYIGLDKQRLLVCSREIEVGDKVKIYESSLCTKKPKEGIVLGEEEKLWCIKTDFNNETYIGKFRVLKVVGEISSLPKELKLGDRFADIELKKMKITEYA